MNGLTFPLNSTFISRQPFCHCFFPGLKTLCSAFLNSVSDGREQNEELLMRNVDPCRAVMISRSLPQFPLKKHTLRRQVDCVSRPVSPQASFLPVAWLTSMLYLSTVLLRGSTACQQIRMHKSISSMPPTITSNFWSLMICREEGRGMREWAGESCSDSSGAAQSWGCPRTAHYLM